MLKLFTFCRSFGKINLSFTIAKLMQYFFDSFAACCAGVPYFGSLQQLITATIPWTSLGTVTLGQGHYRILKQIGEGGYSFVYQVANSETGENFALKKVLIAGPEQSRLAQREVEVMQQCSHRNLLPLLMSSTETFADPSSPAKQAVYMLFPLYTQGSLYEEVSRRSLYGRPLSAAEILHIFRQVCAGALAMHENKPPLAHRDIKPHNVLLRREAALTEHDLSRDAGSHSEAEPLQQEMQQARDLHAVLMDFGSTREARVTISSRAEAVQLQEDAEAHCSAPYRAPELFDVASHCSVDERVDVWSLGCLLYFMMYAVSPFERVLGEAGGSLALAVQNGHAKWPDRDGHPHSLRELVLRCLVLNPSRRPFVSELLPCIDTMIYDLR